jgi:hypothetical protein
MRPIPSAALAVVCAALLTMTVGSAHAQSAAAKTSECTPEQFGQRIDATGEYLRTVSRKTEPELNAKFARLARARGWPAAAAEQRGYELIKDATISDYDRRARNLLLDLDKLGAVDAESATCAKLEQLEQVTRDLREVTNAKVAYVHQKLDAALAGTPGQSAKTSKLKPPTAQPAPPATRPAEPPASPPQRSASTHDWQTSTTPNETAIDRGATPSTALPPRSPRDAKLTYSTEEISHAGRGLFGTISANLASVIRYAVQTYGKPNGYILGTEGGGALLAGLSYGTGELHTKMAPPRTVYWQGPTVGYDLGLTGSRVMFLIYNLETPDDIFDRFGGLGGSAYIVGGVGLTFHQRGDVILAPIRTGLGLRIGANIGYLKFTPKRSLNPF